MVKILIYLAVMMETPKTMTVALVNVKLILAICAIMAITMRRIAVAIFQLS